jgi:sec-independent protein translocase protein TatA
MFGLGAPELLIVLAVVMLLFGGAKVPQLARSLGLAKKEFEAATEDQPVLRTPAPAVVEVTPPRTDAVAKTTLRPGA